MRICLATADLDTGFTPLALMYLKAYLVDRCGHPFDDIAVRQFDYFASAEAIAAEILDCHPDIVGLSCYVWNVTTLMAATRLVKQQRPDVRIVIGGPEVGPIASDVLTRHPDVDIVVKSEGELPFAAIVAAIRDGHDLGVVPGVVFRHGAVLRDTGEAPILQDLNQLPSPHTERYADEMGGASAFVCIETQRGCVFRCAFCFYNKDLSIRNRRFDLDRVKGEILFWLERGVRLIYLMDPVFNLNAKRAKEICRFLAAHKRPDVQVHAEIWAEFVDDEIAGLMRDANFVVLEVGLQTTDGATLASVDRRLRLEAFVAGLGHLKRHGLTSQVQLIHGLPNESPESFRRSLNFAASLDPAELAVFPLMVLPGTELWRKAEALKLDFDPEPPYLLRSHPTMSAKDVAHGRAIARAVALFRSSKVARLLGREPGLTFADIIDAWIDWWAANRADRSLPTGADVHLFVDELCATRQIPAAVYSALARLEYAAPPLDGADQPAPETSIPMWTVES